MTPKKTTVILTALVAAATLALTGCSAASEAPPPAATSASASASTPTLTPKPISVEDMAAVWAEMPENRKTAVCAQGSEGNNIDLASILARYTGYYASDPEVLSAASQMVRDNCPKPIKPTDFTIAVKVKKKKCFGSAGCNITFEIKPTYTGAEDLSTGSWEVTYRVTGDEDGPQINTFTLEDGMVTLDPAETLSTVSSETKITAKVIEVSEQ